MTQKSERVDVYLDHILQAIDRINEYTLDLNEEDYLANTLIQDAVLRNFEIIGEASNKIIKNHPDYASKHADIPFSQAYQMRNAISHGYNAVDQQIVWRSVVNSIPKMHAQICALRVLTFDPMRHTPSGSSELTQE